MLPGGWVGSLLKTGGWGQKTSVGVFIRMKNSDPRRNLQQIFHTKEKTHESTFRRKQDVQFVSSVPHIALVVFRFSFCTQLRDIFVGAPLLRTKLLTLFVFVFVFGFCC